MQDNNAAKTVDKFRGHIPGLDALRAIGICAVLLTHTFPAGISSGITSFLSLSWAFMDSFFVMSGFLITGILLDTRSRPHPLKTFFVRRALRILPVYYLVIGALLLLVYVRHETMREWGSPLWFLVYLGNLPTAIAGSWPYALDGAFVPLWSLQIEEQFYLIFPFLVFGLKLQNLKLLLTALIPISVGLRVLFYFFWPENLYVQYVLLPCHMEGLALGGLIAIRYRSGTWELNRKMLSTAVVTLALATIVIGKLGGWDHGRPLVRTVGFLVSSLASAVLVIWLVEFRSSRLSAPLSWSPLQYLGKISYGIYLVHWPILALMAAVYPYDRSGVPGLVFSALVIGLSVTTASLSWRFVEEPLLRLKNSLTKPPPIRSNAYSATGRGETPIPKEG